MKAGGDRMDLAVTCALGLEELLLVELAELGIDGRAQQGAVEFSGGWRAVWECNWWLRTANRVLVRLATWEARDEKAPASVLESTLDT